MCSKKPLRLFRPAISTASAALVVIALGSEAFANAATGPELSVSNLRTDALVAPIGIADLTPNLSWIDTANVNGAAQSAYQIQAAAGAVSAWSAPATFQIGLTKQSDWTAQWITHPNWTSTSSASAMPLFAKQFTTNSSIVSAMLYVSGIGIVSPSINGTNVGSALLGPGYSNATAHLAYGGATTTVNGLPRAIAQLEITYVSGATVHSQAKER